MIVNRLDVFDFKLHFTAEEFDKLKAIANEQDTSIEWTVICALSSGLKELIEIMAKKET